MDIPIARQDGHRYTDAQSGESYAFRLYPKDLEHLDPASLASHYGALSESLLKMDGEFVKIYFKGGDVFVHTDNGCFALPDTKVESQPDLLDELLGEGASSLRVLNRGDHLKIGGKYLRFFRLKEFPHQISDHGHFDGTGNYFLMMRKVPQDRACSLLDRKRKIFRSDNAGEFADYRSEEGETQAEELYSQIQLGGEALFEAEFWFWILGETEEELAEKTDALMDVFKRNEGEADIEDLGLSEAFLNFVPGVRPSFISPTLLPSHYLLGLLPLSGDFIHEEGISLQSVEGRNVRLDLFSGENFNAAVMGSSGSGKTFLVQKIVDHYLKKDIKAVIIDRGESFDRLAKYHGGTVLEGKINPLRFKDAAFLTEFLCAFIPGGEFPHRQKCLLFKTIRDGLGEKRITNFKTLLSTVDGHIPDFSLYFERHRELFTDETPGMENITYVDTRAYPDDFLRPLFIYLTEYTKNLKGRKIFVFEECWHTLGHDIPYLGEFFRTSRARGIGCIAVTQSMGDLLDSPVGRVVCENAFFKILFSATEENDHLDGDDAGRLSRLQPRRAYQSEFYLKSPDHKKTLKYTPTVLEHERFTSHFEDRKNIRRFIDTFKDHFDEKTLIARWTELKYGQNIDCLLVDASPPEAAPLDPLRTGRRHGTPV